MIVTADRVITQSTGVGRRIGTVELVERLSPTLIEGRITAVEDGQPTTLATTLQVGADGTDPDELLLREGDAGSYVFDRCSPATEAAQRYSLG